MSSRKLVAALGPRRRSALELRGATTQSTGSVASQLLAKCRGVSLQEDGHRQHDVLAQLTKPSSNRSDDSDADDEASGSCSHRSSISTIAEDDETEVTTLVHDHHQSEASSSLGERSETREGNQASDNEDLTAEAEDCLMPLPTYATPSCGGGLSRPIVSTSATATTPAPGAVPLASKCTKAGTVLRDHPQHELYLFREEAEYSDYVDAWLSGVHIERDAVVYYELDVHLSQMQWHVLRRFSEFRSLRQRLVKHLSRRQRSHLGDRAATTTAPCKICANILQTIEQAPFPSRTKHTPWFSVFHGRQHVAWSAVITADRKRKLQAFVTSCLFAVRGLRQHSRLMCDSSACEISVALRLIEEFLGLSFTRYMRFLNERGVLATDGEVVRSPHATTDNCDYSQPRVKRPDAQRLQCDLRGRRTHS